MDSKELMEMAKQARETASVPISGFKVGAALLTKCGKVYTGCNIEDPSGIGVTNICAERCAIVKAVSEGHKEFSKIAVAGGPGQTPDSDGKLILCTPCGACRQYLNSYNPQITVVCLNDDGEIKELALPELLPYSFNEKF